MLASGVGNNALARYDSIQIITVSFIVIPSIISFYSSYLFLFPSFINTRKVSFLMINILVISTISSLISLFITSLLIGDQFTFQTDLDLFTEKFILATLISLFNITAGFIIKGFISWYSDLKIKEELQQKSYLMELSLIESKLDPHFLFNSINNIDVLVLRDSKMASEYLKNLSGILRFILYESKGKRIKLSEEIDYIMKYVALQKIRTSNEKYVTIDIKGEFVSSLIYPMTFIPFIENAFKHSTNKKIAGAIEIAIFSTEKQIDFKCINKSRVSTKLENTGIGNELIMKRLQLLYPNQHILETSKGDDTYIVNLKIDI
jgi:two-component system LytT family sensor kinase